MKLKLFTLHMKNAVKENCPIYIDYFVPDDCNCGGVVFIWPIFRKRGGNQRQVEYRVLP